MRKLALLCAFLFLAVPCGARTITVDDDGPADFNNIQAGIDDANDGDTVEVQPGTYTGPGNRDIDFLGKAITVRSTEPNDHNIVSATVIDCNGSYGNQHRGFYFHSGENSNSILDGLTITNGYIIRTVGAGVYCEYAGPTIRNCTFSANFKNGYGYGAGLYVLQSPNPVTITNCTFSQNQCGYLGGGGGFRESSVTLINCTFTGNYALYGGGGLWSYRSNITLVNCIISGNWTDHALFAEGGGIEILVSDLTFVNCVISNNHAKNNGRGGGIFIYSSMNKSSSCELINCTFVANTASKGNALYCDSQPSYNSNLEITNCIMWDGGNEIWNNDNSTITINYSNVQGGWPGIGNIDTDPCFVEPGYWDVNNVWVDGDYHLLEVSPCIDAGDPNFVPEPNETDLDGNPRVVDGNEDGIPIVDMGAYEYSPPIPAEVDIKPETLNLNSKGKWISCTIRLPDGYSTAYIDRNSIYLEDVIKAQGLQVNGRLTIAKFSRPDVQAILDVGDNVEVAISGELTDGTVFKGIDTIKVIDKGGGKAGK